jgi:hypothetical protein
MEILLIILVVCAVVFNEAIVKHGSFKEWLNSVKE